MFVLVSVLKWVLGSGQERKTYGVAVMCLCANAVNCAGQIYIYMSQARVIWKKEY